MFDLVDRINHSYAKGTLKSRQATTCVICTEDFKDSDKVVELQCDERHVFHQECISGWLVKKKDCPICRHAVALTEKKAKDDQI